MEPIITFAKYSGSENDYIKRHKTRFSGLTKDFPKNIHLLTLEQWTDNQYLFRLEHFYQNKESKTLSVPVKVELKNLFSGFEVTEAIEQALGANQEANNLKNRFKFKTTDENKNQFEEKTQINDKNLTISLNPMEIKTFLIKVNKI